MLDMWISRSFHTLSAPPSGGRWFNGRWGCLGSSDVGLLLPGGVAWSVRAAPGMVTGE